MTKLPARFAIRLTRALVLGLLLASTVTGQDIRFPADAGVRSVKDFGAVGDGKTDDTVALNKALEGTGLLYFPVGTYLVSGQLKPPAKKGGAPSRRILQGEHRDRSIIRLADRTPGFDDPQKRQQVLKISWDIAQAFRNSVRDLTIDVGSGNPGASALGFFASNQGNVQRVNLRAGDGSGSAGLDLDLGDNGPLSVSDVHISGFDIGIRIKYGCGYTIENVVMDKIRSVGIRSEHSPVWLRRVRYQGDGPLLSDAWNSSTVMFDAEATTTQPQASAIKQEGRVLLRNVSQRGFTALVAGKTGSLSAERVDEWHSHGAQAAFPGSTQRTLNLPVRETPIIPLAPLAQWVSVADFPPGDKDGKADWGPALQAAIDSGKSTVYFPLGKGAGYPILTPVTLRAKVERVIGLEQTIASKDGPTFIIGDGEAPCVVIEHVDSIYTKLNIRHEAKRSLLLANMCFELVEKRPGSGDLFLFDTVIQTLWLNGGNCWSRGLNCEYSQEHSPGGIHVVNDGAAFWMFGFKNEGDGTKVDTKNGGRSELYAHVLSNKATPADQKPVLFTITDAAATINLHENVLRKQPSGTLVVETRGGERRTFLAGQAIRGGNNSSAMVNYGGAQARAGEQPPLVGYPSAGAAPAK
jgi:Pectate lyase superfamily protein